MRGTLADIRHSLRQTGIIPAYAGNTFYGVGNYIELGDHPRVCGEHRLRDITAPNRLGSSPRMRGTHGWVPRRHRFDGIIPAYAGNTK